MAKSASEMENWHRHRGKGTIFFGFLLLIIGLMSYYSFSWPLIFVTVGILVILFGFLRMMK